MSNTDLTFYPAYCYPSSPTYFTWVKLSGYDIHSHLQSRDGQQRQHVSSAGNPLFFFLNHPIQFVQVAGVVVAIEDFHPHIFLFTLDDSSGRTVDVVWRKPKLDDDNNQNNGRDINAASRQEIIIPGRHRNGSAAAAVSAGAKAASDNTSLTEGPSLLPLLLTLQIGSLILAKGTITSFRGTRQLSLLRLTTFTPTDELKFIASRTTYHNTTLSMPWTVSSSAQKKLLAKATGDKRGESESIRRARRRQELKEKKEREDAVEIVRGWEEDEKERAKEAEEARRDGVEVGRVLEEKRRTRRSRRR